MGIGAGAGLLRSCISTGGAPSRCIDGSCAKPNLYLRPGCPFAAGAAKWTGQLTAPGKMAPRVETSAEKSVLRSGNSGQNRRGERWSGDLRFYRAAILLGMLVDATGLRGKSDVRSLAAPRMAPATRGQASFRYCRSKMHRVTHRRAISRLRHRSYVQTQQPLPESPAVSASNSAASAPKY